MDKIFQQLKSYCNCTEVEEKNVFELIGLVSMATCWTRKPCDTFLTSEREEVIDLESCLPDCGVYTFDPFYHPFDKDSFTFTLIKQQGLEEESIPITDYVYSEVDDNFRLDLPLPNCNCVSECTCGCKAGYKLLVTYEAGYDELPECLLPIFCEALYYVNELNRCDCEDCPPCNTKYQEAISYVTGEGATITDKLADYFVRTLTRQFVRELSLISLCADNDDIWGIVV